MDVVAKLRVLVDLLFVTLVEQSNISSDSEFLKFLERREVSIMYNFVYKRKSRQKGISGTRIGNVRCQSKL